VPQYDDGLVDVVHGKDRGVLILLHGASGTGKTLAAEAVAASLKKPLLLVRVADLGSVSREIEQNLTQFVTLVERCGCILLMHDADAILGQRTRSDWEGNNITSSISVTSCGELCLHLDSVHWCFGVLCWDPYLHN